MLLEQTLNGAVGILTEVLGLVHPGAFSRASRARRACASWRKSLHLPGAWQFELAAALSQIGLVILPPETLARYDSGEALTAGDERIIASCPAVGRRLIEMIPRLDLVGRMVASQDRRYADYPEQPEDDAALTIATGAQMLRAALALDRHMSRGLSVPAALSVLRREVGEYNPELLALLEAFESDDTEATIQALRVKDLAVDMVIHEDILASNGLLLVAKGQAISLPVLERLRSFHEGMGVVEPVLVRVPPPEAVEPDAAEAAETANAVDPGNPAGEPGDPAGPPGERRGADHRLAVGLVGAATHRYVGAPRPRAPQADPSISASSSSVRACSSSGSARVSTFSRSTGSVFDIRRLNRQVSKASDRPSVRSTARATASQRASTRAIAAAGSARRRLISPLAG